LFLCLALELFADRVTVPSIMGLYKLAAAGMVLQPGKGTAAKARVRVVVLEVSENSVGEDTVKGGHFAHGEIDNWKNFKP